jgi:chromate transporter
MPRTPRSVATFFLKLGSIGFGGPIVLLGMLEDEWVHKRKYLTQEAFQTEVALAKIFPGPLSTLVGISLARKKFGLRTGMISGIAFILPAFLLILIFGLLLNSVRRFQGLDQTLVGLQLGAIVVTTVSVFRLCRKQYQTPRLYPWMGLVAWITLRFSAFEPVAVIASGLIAILLYQAKDKLLDGAPLILLFLFTVGASFTTFGSGIAIVPALESLLVAKTGWVSPTEFLDGLLLAQITPGPLLIIATYLGFKAHSLSGALVTTTAAFLPAFLFGLYLIPKLRSKLLKARLGPIFLEGVWIGVAGALFGATIKLATYLIPHINPPIAAGIGGMAILIQVFRSIPAPAVILGVAFCYSLTLNLLP